LLYTCTSKNFVFSYQVIQALTVPALLQASLHPGPLMQWEGDFLELENVLTLTVL
jgi:hypothetical protein